MTLLNSESSSDVTDTTSVEKFDEQKEARIPSDLKNHIKRMGTVVKKLENSLTESQQNDHSMIMTLQNDQIKSQKLNNQLEEARKENKQLLNIIQQKCDSRSSSRTRSHIGMSRSPISSVSMVHLQYKYEELLENYQGLLKVLESRVKEIQDAHKENENLRGEMHNLSVELSECDMNLKKLCDKYFALRTRKDEKISKLKKERDTLKMVHDHLLKLLEDQHFERDMYLRDILQNSEDANQALLLQEIRRANKLQHENFQLHRDILLLRAKVCKSKEKRKNKAFYN